MKPPVFKLSREICDGTCRNLTMVLQSKRRSLDGLGRVGSRVECLDLSLLGCKAIDWSRASTNDFICGASMRTFLLAHRQDHSMAARQNLQAPYRVFPDK